MPTTFASALLAFATTALAITAALAGPPASDIAGARTATAPQATSSRSAPRATWPTDAPHTVLHPFAAPATVYSAGHRGIDVAAEEGQPVYAIAAGTVSFAGVVVDRPLISLTHGGGLVSSLEPVTPTVAAGTLVAAGQQIGTVAHSAHCPQTCLHLGVRLNGAYISPLVLLATLPRAVLLPLTPG